MNSKIFFTFRGRWIFSLFTFLILFTHLRGEGLARFSSLVEPVWGRKPVLAYFVLTPSLADELSQGVALTETEFMFLQSLAQQETDQLKDLEHTTWTIIQDENLTEAEKYVKITKSGYNEAVFQILDGTAQSLQTTLNEQTYNQLVAWIESRWEVERSLHGAVQAKNVNGGSRTYTIYATHFDSSGSYAVALPDKCVKFADNGNSICEGSGYETGNYSVQLSYDDTTTVQTFDSGPWNVDDNFWASLSDPHPRRLFTDLPAGMPAAQAAYFDDYNDGLDQYGRTVIAPFAIDLGDGVGEDIGLIYGSNDWIDVTFNWTTGWDSLNPEIVTLLAPTDLNPAYTGDMCVTAWHRIFPLLEEGGQAAYLTLNVDDPNQSTNSAEWQPDIPEDGEYQVLAFIPNHGPIDWLCPTQTIDFDTSDAEYTIHHANGETTVSKNQKPMANQYLDLGTFEFEAGTDGKVTLSDLNDEENLSRTVAFSAMQFRQILPPSTPTATPSPTPTPTPTPEPMVKTGLKVVNPGDIVNIPVSTHHLQNPGLGDAIVNVQYDPAVVNAVACQTDPGNLFDTENCLLDFDSDDIFPDAVQLTVHSAGGVIGDPILANLSFEAVGAPGAFTWLELFLMQFVYPGGSSIPANTFNGMICLTPCKNVTYLTIISK